MTAPAGIRRAAIEELEAVERLWTALTAHHATLDSHFVLRPGSGAEIRERVRALLRDPDVLVLLDVEGDGTATGLCVARHDTAPPIHAESARVEISDLWIAPERRRCGRGRALVGAVRAWAGARGVQRIEVRASVHNAEGRAFWRRLGFAPFMDVLDLRL